MDPYESNSFEDSVDQSGAGPQEESPASSPAPEPLIRKIPGRYSEILASVRASAAATDSTKVEQEAIEGFKAIMAARQAARTARNPTYAVIPPFFFRKKPGMDNTLLSRVQREAYRLNLIHQAQQAPSDDQLKSVSECLGTHLSSPRDGTDRINYDDFCAVRDTLRDIAPPVSPFFTATTFLKFPRDEHDRISTRCLFQYICGTVGLRQTRIRLSTYDEVGDGYLREYDLETYISDLIPTTPNLRGLQESFKQFYVFTAVRKFMYFLDPKRTGKISIQDLVGSKIMAELLSLQAEPPDVPKPAAPKGGAAAGAAQGPVNWFSASNALRVYGQYLDLDTDMNGMLSKEEMMAYAGGTFTRAFFDRLYQECLTYGGEMDFKMYLDFVLTMENRNTPEAISFMFRLLDVRGKGYLDAATINYFFKEVVSKLAGAGHDPVNPADVQDEIFDMVTPAHPHRITLEELKKSKQGHIITFMLVDCNAFWQYDNRESLMQQKEAEEAGDTSK